LANHCLIRIFATEFATSRKGITMENVQWKVEGMDCSSCALTIHKYLEKQGMKNVKVNSVSGDVSFEMNGGAATPKLIKGLDDLGYHVANQHQITERKNHFFQHIFTGFSFVFHLHLCSCFT
jgi:Cu+-exporting ATPase